MEQNNQINDRLKRAESEAAENLQAAIMKLIQNEPFFAAMLLNMTRNFVTRLPTLGVNVTDTVNLYVNPFFWNDLKQPERIELLKHEVYHVLNNHIGRYKDLEPNMFDGEKRQLKEVVQDMMKASTLNQAADYAINEYLPNLPKKFHLFNEQGDMIVQPDQMMDDQGNVIDNPDAGKPLEAQPLLVDNLAKQHPGLERRQNMEYYYDILQKKRKGGGGGGEGQPQKGKGQGQGKDGQGNGTVDDHSIWYEGNPDAEYVAEKIKQTVGKAMEQSNMGIGTLPGDLAQMINALYYKPKDWRADLQRFVAKTSEIILESSRKIRNRRFGVLFPGIKVYPKLHLVTAWDTSGSMPDESLEQIWAECAKIHNMGVEITVIEADCVVHKVYKFDPKKPIKVNGRGGTAYQPALDKATEIDCDGLIYFGDMDMADQPKKPKYPVLWAIYGNQNPPAKWGWTTRIKINKKK